jgi:Niemann-Pick C1 protein
MDICLLFPCRWFDFMGDAAENPYVPFQINYVPTEVATADIDPLDPLVVPCSQSINVSSNLCFFQELIGKS